MNDHYLTDSQPHLVRSPWDQTIVGETSLAGPAGMSRAAETIVNSAARAAAEPAHIRAERLDAVASAIEAQSATIAALIRMEAGKPITLAKAEAGRAVSLFRAAAAWCRRDVAGDVLAMESLPQGAGHRGYSRRFPIGPTLAITPFNFPLNLVAHKIAPAVAVGATLIVKPSPRTPLSALWLQDRLREAGIPEEQVLVLPAGPEALEPLFDDDRIRLITFTGSAKVGWDLRQRCPQKRVTLELGGTAPLLVCRDAEWESLMPKIVASAFGYAGQTCISLQHLYVDREVMPAFREAFIEATRHVVTGDPLSNDTICGPMITKEAADHVQATVQDAVDSGAQVRVPLERTAPTVLKPAILDGVPEGHRLSREEIFGPVALMHEVADWREAVQRMNQSPYGIHAGVLTRDIHIAHHLFEQLETGGVLINEVPTFRTDNMPYGGVKQSGLGREGIPAACEDMTEVRTLLLRLEEPGL